MAQPIITPNDLPELKRLYLDAVESKAEAFKFRGADLLTSYAKYLIEYLESKC